MKYLIVITCLLSQFAYAHKEIHLVVPRVEDSFSEKKTSYWEFLRNLKKYAYKDLIFHYLPLKRAIRTVLIGKADCFMGGDLSLARKYTKKKLIQSRATAKAKFLVFTLSDDSKISQAIQLRGESITFLRGFENLVMPKARIQKSKAILSDTVEQMIKLLEHGRVKAIIHPFSSNFNNKLSLLHHDPEFSLLDYSDTVICLDNPDNRKFIKMVNNYIKSTL